MYNAQSRAATLLLALLLALFSTSRSTATFSSLFVFGDGVSSTTDGPGDSSIYYGSRYCNGRVWVELLAQWQGLAFDHNKNLSYFGHDSVELQTNAANFVAPPDVATALFVVWCNNADFVQFLTNIEPPYYDSGPWNASIYWAIQRHVNAVNSLYAKGARTIVMPNAANVAAIPLYNDFDANDRAFVRQRVIEFNAQFEGAMASLVASKPGLVMYRPDAFTFFEQVQATPWTFGLVNPVPYNAAVVDLPNANRQFGPGIDYVFWDYWHPTAKFQMHLADLTQSMILPPKVNSLAVAGGTVQMQLANVPLGRAGFVQGSATLQPPWQQDAVINEPSAVGGNTSPTISFPASGPQRFYRAGFPVVWTWP